MQEGRDAHLAFTLTAIVSTLTIHEDHRQLAKTFLIIGALLAVGMQLSPHYLIQTSDQPDAISHLTDGKKRTLYIRLRPASRVVPDR